jgi:hypothetical protein
MVRGMREGVGEKIEGRGERRKREQRGEGERRRERRKREERGEGERREERRK